MNAALVAMCILSIAQPADEQRALTQAREEARVFAKAFKDDDHAKLADRTFAPWVEKLGTRTRVLLAWRKQTSTYRHQGLQVESYEVEPARELVKAGNDWLCLLPTTLKFKGLEGPAQRESHLLALSRDQGKSWRFLDIADTQSTNHVKTWLPDLPKSWSLPKAGALKFEKTSKDAVFIAKAGNFKTMPPKDWTEGQLTEKNAHLILEKEDDKIYVFAEPMDISIDDVIQYVQYNQNTKKMRRLFAQKEMLVAGEKAKYVRFEDSNDVQLLQYYLCAFNHHGMSYRIIGVRQGNDAKVFEAAYLSILQRFAFLADRTDWLKKNEGVATKTVMLGGLAWFEVDRPRWAENTFDAPADYQVLDAVDFRSPTSDAWINVTLHEAHGSLGAELQEAGAHYSLRLQNPKIEALAFPNSKGKWTGLQIRGTDSGGGLGGGLPPIGFGRNEERSFLIAITILDGIAAWVVLETTRGRQDELRLDFDVVLETFVLQEQSKPRTPLAFPIRRYDAGRGADARVTALLKKVTPLFPGSRTHEIIGFTSDGKQAILNTPTGFFLEEHATKKRTPLPIKATAGRPTHLALSSDRKWLAWQAGDEITVQPMGFGFARKIKAKPGMFSFSPNNRELLHVASRSRGRFDYDDDYYPPQDYRGGAVTPAFQVSKIERVPLDGSPPTPLFDWPLIRVMAFLLSPDGKQLAVVTNRDMPRTQQYGGLLYVCKPDGSDLRLVNKEPAEYRSIAWSADGKSIFAARRLTRGAIAQPGGGYLYDVERIAIENGAAVNLTQTSRIDRLWSGGSDLFFEIRDGTLPISQQGIFRINADALVKAAPPQAVAKPLPTDLPARVAARLQKALGKTPVDEFVPTEASLAKMAKDFAAAIKEETDVDLDNSPESLDRLKILIDRLELGAAKHPINVLGVGACYGETLRLAGGAKWHLKPVPFGKWSVSRQPVGANIAMIVFPFSESVEWARFTGRMLSSFDLKESLRRQDCLLVYPPSDVNSVLEANYKDFMQARKFLDDGNVDAALEAYRREFKKRPKNAALAREIVELCRAVDRHDTAKAFTKEAVEAGIETTDLLVQYADELTKTDMAKALPYYRKAAQIPGAIAPTLIKLGKAYQKTGDLAMAESCWRRAYLTAIDGERNEIRRLMKLPELPPLGSRFDSFAPPSFKDKDD